jgi:hypothetical protein
MPTQHRDIATFRYDTTRALFGGTDPFGSGEATMHTAATIAESLAGSAGSTSPTSASPTTCGRSMPVPTSLPFQYPQPGLRSFLDFREHVQGDQRAARPCRPHDR